MNRSRAILAVAAALLAPAHAHADDADPVVVRVGPSALRASDVARRLADVPPYQLRTLGRTPQEIRSRFVQTVLVPEMLHGAEAERTKLVARPGTRIRIRQALRRTLVDALRADARSAGIADSDVASYYAAHETEFRSPERIAIWRILVADESLARKILADSAGPGGPERWARAAREHSLDKATSLRNGLLGFVGSDGRTDVPQVQVDAALFAAAAKVRDGELVAAPVPEAGKLAVVWRRGTRPKTEQSLDSVRDAIRRLLIEQRTDASLRTLETDLRSREVRDESPDLVSSLSEPTATTPPPARSAPAPGSAQPVPRETDRGLR